MRPYTYFVNHVTGELRKCSNSHDEPNVFLVAWEQISSDQYDTYLRVIEHAKSESTS